MRLVSAAVLSVVFIAGLVPDCTPAGAQDWIQWRGPNRDGVVTGFVPPPSWPSVLKRLWSTPVGGGYSSPVVSGNRVFIQARRGDLELVHSVELGSGQAIWSSSYDAPFTRNKHAAGMGNGPHSTPVLYRGCLYTLGATAILSCFEARTGKLKWRKDFSHTVDTSKFFHGTAMSPVVSDGMIIVHVGDDRGGEVIFRSRA